MTKQRKTPLTPLSEGGDKQNHPPFAKGGLRGDLTASADDLLLAIRGASGEIERIENEYNVAVAALTENYGDRLAPLQSLLQDDAKSLIALMKKNKTSLFDGTDVVYLKNGSLIHSLADKISIPRDALDKCEELGFLEAIKIAKSLDREAVEKWPDERLLLIGAERKPVEKFSYDLKKENPPSPPFAKGGSRGDLTVQPRGNT